MTWFAASMLCVAMAVPFGSQVSQERGGMEMTPAASPDSFQAMMDAAMSGMDRDMARAKMSGHPDHDFASMMVPHHQGAIAMAKAELLYGKDPVLRRLAQEIIIDQDSEITVMQSYLHKNPMHSNAR